MDEILFQGKRHQAPRGQTGVPDDSLDMFDDRPSWLAVPQSDLEKRFAEFHRRNPHVYDALEKRALALIELGRTRLGIADLVEDLRYDPRLVTQGEHFKLNNSYRAFYARLLIHNHSKLASVIGVREQTHQQQQQAHQQKAGE